MGGRMGNSGRGDEDVEMNREGGEGRGREEELGRSVGGVRVEGEKMGKGGGRGVGWEEEKEEKEKFFFF